MNRGYNTFRPNFRSVILSEASAGFADAESKDPYAPHLANEAKRLSDNALSIIARREHDLSAGPCRW